MKKITIVLCFCLAAVMATAAYAYDKEQLEEVKEAIMDKDKELKEGRLRFDFDEKRFHNSVDIGYMHREELYEKGEKITLTVHN